MPILTVASSKGGVGKSMVASNLAAVLGESDGQVLAVDSDSNCSLTQAFHQRASADSDLGSLLACSPGEDLPDVSARIISDVCPGLDLLPANNVSMMRAERLMSSEAGTERVLRGLLRPLLERYRWIVVDTPASLNNLTLAGAVAADAVIGVFTSEPLSIQGVLQLLSWLGRYQKAEVIDATFLGMLNNMFEARRVLTAGVNGEVEELLSERGYRLFESRVPRLVRIAESTWEGRPVTILAPSSPGAVALRAFVAEVVEHMSVPS